jgi:hypothetical protein
MDVKSFITLAHGYGAVITKGLGSKLSLLMPRHTKSNILRYSYAVLRIPFLLINN